MNDDFDMLKLENQLCFPLYAVSREVIKKYKPFLDEIGLTYTQYITMMVMWEEKEIFVKNLGAKLHLDSGTLTPVLNALEKKGFIIKKRSENDKRDVSAVITKEGIKLKKAAQDIPKEISSCIPINQKDALSLYRILNKILEKM